MSFVSPRPAIDPLHKLRQYLKNNTYTFLVCHLCEKNPLSGNRSKRLRMYKVLSFKFSRYFTQDFILPRLELLTFNRPRLDP